MSTDREPAISWRIGALEIATSFVVAALFVWACSTIRVNPLDRTGQVSGMAAIELRLLWFGLPLLAILVLAAKLRGGRTFPIAARLVCASFAGLSSAAVAGGILVALGRSPYGLGGIDGDSGVLISWAEYVKQGINVSPLYPPLQTQLLAWMSEVLGMPTHYAMKWFQIVGIAAVGPLCYATWRLLLRPGWALGVGVLASVPLVEAYRQYPFLVLVVLIPLLVKFLDLIRHSYELSVTDAVRHAVLFGMALGALFLLYSGWYQWSAPGVLAAAAIVFPWRRPWRMAVLLGGLALFVFVLFAYKYLTAVVEAPPIKDDFFYFDASVEPAYIAMWRGDLPGTVVGAWPPLGELGGVGLFTVVLAIGIGVAIAFGYSHTLVITVGSIMAGTWLFRFWHAHNMYETKLVQLYPRTTAELLYCGLILTLFGIHLVVERSRARAPADSPLRSPFALVGACAGFLFLSMSSSAALTDKYMPKDAANDYGRLAWVAVKTPRLEQSQAVGAAIEVSSSYDDKGYSVRALVDGKRDTVFSSQLGKTEDHEEWLILRMPNVREFSTIVLTPAADGFPIDFAIELWDGVTWVPRITKTNYPDSREPQRFSFPQREATSQIRIRATKLRQVDGNYVLRLAEIALYR